MCEMIHGASIEIEIQIMCISIREGLKKHIIFIMDINQVSPKYEAKVVKHHDIQ
jgi:hypothetical protein